MIDWKTYPGKWLEAIETCKDNQNVIFLHANGVILDNKTRGDNSGVTHYAVIDRPKPARITPEAFRESLTDEVGKRHTLVEMFDRLSVVAEKPKPAVDITKPRVWAGKAVEVDHWCFLSGVWDHYIGLPSLEPDNIFVGGSGPKPTADPTNMQLEECSEIDWETKHD